MEVSSSSFKCDEAPNSLPEPDTLVEVESADR